MSLTGADLDDLAALRDVLRLTGHAVDDATADAAAALARFRSSSSEFVPSWPDHAGTGARAAERLEVLGRRVDGVGEALAAVEAGQWFPATDPELTFGDARTIVTAQVGPGLTIWNGIKLFRAQRAVTSATRTIDAAGDALSFLRGVDSLSAARRGVTEASYALHLRAWSGAVEEVSYALRNVATAPLDPRTALRVGWRSGDTFLTRVGGANAAFSATRAGMVVRAGSRVLGVVGVGVDAATTFHALAEGDYEQAAISGARTAGGAMMLSGVPPVQVAGAVVVAGTYVYEYRHELADFAGDVADTVGDVAGAAGDALADVGGGILDTGGDLVEGAGRLLGGLL